VLPHCFTLGREGGLQIEVMDIGATWLGCLVPVPGEGPRQVLLGHATAAGQATEPGFLGATVGRYANRIAGARFTLGGREHVLAANEGPNILHGGADGFHRRRWQLRDEGPLHLRLALHSPAGDQGFPGALDAEVSYRIDPDARAVSIGFDAVVSAACPVSITNHAYFNLDANPGTVLAHRLRVGASQWLPVDEAALPLGHLAPVEGTPFDLRQPRPIGLGLVEHEQQRRAGGFDHCYRLDEAAASGDAAAADLVAGDGGLAMQLHTNYPGLQVYTGNHLPEARGRGGQPYPRHAGIALEPQFLPDSPNHPAWREMGCLLQPGQRLQRWMRVAFSVP
jgi:aldose 1-epimerase